MIYLLILGSFLLDDVFYQVIGSQSIFFPLCTLLSLVIIYPFFREKITRYYGISFLLGFFYDICFSGTIFLQGILFFLVSIVIRKSFAYLSINLLNTYFLGIGVILIYRLFSMIFFVSLKISPWNLEIFLDSVLSSLLFNSFYLLIFYFLAKKIRQNLTKKKYSSLKMEE